MNIKTTAILIASLAFNNNVEAMLPWMKSFICEQETKAKQNYAVSRIHSRKNSNQKFNSFQEEKIAELDNSGFLVIKRIFKSHNLSGGEISLSVKAGKSDETVLRNGLTKPGFNKICNNLLELDQIKFVIITLTDKDKTEEVIIYLIFPSKTALTFIKKTLENLNSETNKSRMKNYELKESYFVY